MYIIFFLPRSTFEAQCVARQWKRTTLGGTNMELNFAWRRFPIWKKICNTKEVIIPFPKRTLVKQKEFVSTWLCLKLVRAEAVSFRLAKQDIKKTVICNTTIWRTWMFAAQQDRLFVAAAHLVKLMSWSRCLDIKSVSSCCFCNILSWSLITAWKKMTTRNLSVKTGFYWKRLQKATRLHQVIKLFVVFFSCHTSSWSTSMLLFLFISKIRLQIDFLISLWTDEQFSKRRRLQNMQGKSH